MESVKAFKRKMLLWTSNWSQEDAQESAEKVPFTPDAIEIAGLLQASGFRVRFMDRCLPKGVHPVAGVPSDRPTCRVIVICPRSGIRMELEAQTSTCRCPSPDESGVGHSWTLNEPTDEEVAKAVEPLGRKPSTEISKSMSELIGGLVRVMNLFSDKAHNDTREAVDWRNENQPESTTSIPRSNSPMKTPATGIAVVTPNAPCVPKALPGDSKSAIPGRYRSLDTLIGVGGTPDDLLPEPGQLTPKDENSETETRMEVDGELDTTITYGPGSAGKKFISKSSPAVNCTERFVESSNFAFEEGEDGSVNPGERQSKKQKLLRSNTYVTDIEGANDAEEEPRRGPPPRRTPSPLTAPNFNQSSILINKLQEIQLAVSDVIFMVAENETNLTNIGDVSKASKAVAGAVQNMMTENSRLRPIRCLSDFGSVPNLGRAATTVRSIPRPNMKRYSVGVGAPATPTTSRRSGATNAVDRTTTITSTAKKASTTTAGSSKSVTSKMSSNRLSVSNGIGQPKVCSASANSPINNSTSKNKDAASALTPNRRSNSDKRYSNLQSSIPKPGTKKN